MKSAKHILGYLFIVMTAMALWSCEKSETDLLDSVPDNSGMIVTVNLDKVLKMAGCQVKGNAYVLSPDLDKLTKGTVKGAIEALNRFRQYVDTERMVIYGTLFSPIVTFKIKDDADQAAIFKPEAGFSAQPDRDGFKVYKVGDYTLLVKGSQAWVASKADDIVKACDNASTHSIKSLESVYDMLSGDTPLNIAYQAPQLGYQWLCASISLTDRMASTTIKVIDSDGQVVPVGEGFDTINTDILRYFPTNTQIGAACTIPRDYDWATISDLVASFGSQATRANYDLMFTVLKKVDGTMALAINPAGGSGALATMKPGAWDITFIAHIPTDEIAGLIENIKRITALQGVKLTPEADGLYSTNISAIVPEISRIYFGRIDDYFVMSTRKPDNYGGNSAESVFFNQRVGAFIEVPYKSETMKAFKLPYGLNVETQLNEDAISVNARFNGSNSSFLPTLISLLANP